MYSYIIMCIQIEFVRVREPTPPPTVAEEPNKTPAEPAKEAAPKETTPSAKGASRSQPTAARFMMALLHVAREQEAKPQRAPLPKGVLDKRLAEERENQRRAEMRRSILESKVCISACAPRVPLKEITLCTLKSEMENQKVKQKEKERNWNYNVSL